MSYKTVLAGPPGACLGEGEPSRVRLEDKGAFCCAEQRRDQEALLEVGNKLQSGVDRRKKNWPRFAVYFTSLGL